VRCLPTDERWCEWQQCKTKMTQLKVQLQDEQGVPPPHPCPHASRLVYPQRLTVVPCACGRPACPGSETLQGGGLELQLTLLNATTMQEISDKNNRKKNQGDGLLAEIKESKKVRLETPLKVRLTGSSHTFNFFVMLLSTEISALGRSSRSRRRGPTVTHRSTLCASSRAPFWLAPALSAPAPL
jgi:hypothetical protein